MHFRWTTIFFGILFCGALSTSFASTNTADLTTEERNWISRRSAVRVGMTPEWEPFSHFEKDGTAFGIDADLLKLISERTGLKFEIVPTASWEKTLALAKERRIDVTTSTVQTPQREAYFQFTRSYAKSISVIVAQEGNYRFSHILLLKKATLAQAKRHLVTLAVQERLPDASVLLEETQQDCFEAVAAGKADVTVADLFTATQYFNTHPKAKLGISGVVLDFEFPLRLAVRREQPELTSILDKALATVTEEEMNLITRHHLTFELQGANRAALFRKWIKLILVGSAIVGSLLAVWNFFLCKQIRARRKAEADLLALNRSLEVFSHSISHDLRAPVRAISGFATLLKEEYGEKIDAVGRDYLDRIISSAERMSSLVRDVLAYSKTARSEFPMHAVSLDAIVQQLIGEFPVNQRPFFKIDSELPEVWGNAGLISQCISNLLSNAIKFVPPDRSPRIHLRAEQDILTCKLWIEDNGIGIAPENQERIFKMFERVRTPGYEGAGIGLALIAKAMERMNGRAGVESELGKGSRFWIQLPLSAPSKSEVKSGSLRRFLRH